MCTHTHLESNWHGLEYVKVEDVHSDMARSHRQQYRQRSQAPIHVIGVNNPIKDQQLKFI